MILQALSRQIKVRYYTSRASILDKRLVKTQIKQLKEHTTKAQQEQLSGEVSLTQEQYQQKKQQSQGGKATQLKTDDLIAIKRYEIKDDLHLKTNQVELKDVAFYQEKGQFHVANYQSMLNGIESAQKNDQADKEQGVAKTNAQWRSAKVKLLNTLFEQLGIDKATGKGEYHKTQAKQAREAIKADDMLNRYVTFKLNLEVNGLSADINFVNKILKKLLGLKCEGYQARINIRIDPTIETR